MTRVQKKLSSPFLPVGKLSWMETQPPCLTSPCVTSYTYLTTFDIAPLNYAGFSKVIGLLKTQFLQEMFLHFQIVFIFLETEVKSLCECLCAWSVPRNVENNNNIDQTTLPYLSCFSLPLRLLLINEFLGIYLRLWCKYGLIFTESLRNNTTAFWVVYPMHLWFFFWLFVCLILNCFCCSDLISFFHKLQSGNFTLKKVFDDIFLQ